MRAMMFAVVVPAVLLSGCGTLNFNAKEDKGLAYYEPVPYFLLKTSMDCTFTGEVVSIPGQKKYFAQEARLFGSDSVSLKLSNGIITEVGHVSDSKIPETIAALSGLASALKPLKSNDAGKEKDGEKKECAPKAALYPIKDGVVQGTPIKVLTF